jgi:hypothetical protein
MFSAKKATLNSSFRLNLNVLKYYKYLIIVVN